MNKKQYNNVIDWTIKHEEAAKSQDSLEAARAIFKNMGVALPNGSMQEVFETIKTNDYMGWKSCTMEEAQQAADKGVAAIGISEEQIVVLAANDEDEPVAQTASVMLSSSVTMAETKTALEYYSYSCGTTTDNGTTDDLLPPTVTKHGILTIFAGNNGGSSSLNTSGHAFISFKNASTVPVALGGYNVQAGEEITLGTWNNQSSHVGLWYNLESYCVNVRNELGNRVSLTINVTEDDIDIIDNFISNHDTWSYLYNCSSFATDLWNSVSSITLSAGLINTPTSLMNSIQSNPPYEIARAIQYNEVIGYMEAGQFVPATARNANTDATQGGDVVFTVPINFDLNSRYI